MSSDYTLILRACPESHRESAAVFIGKLFSLKEHTTQQIVASCPIVLLTGLGREEAAAMHLLVHSLGISGAQVELSGEPPGDLPKIDWPRRPQVFKRELSEWVGDLLVPLPVQNGTARLIDLLLAAIEGGKPVIMAAKPEAEAAKPGTKAQFKGANLPEVTPFSTPALVVQAPTSEPRPLTRRTPLPAPLQPRATLPPAPSAFTPSPPTTMSLPPPPPPPPSTPAASAGGPSDDPMSRLNELFPDEEGGGFMSGKEDITSILDKLLPDEQPASVPGGASVSSGSRKLNAIGSGGFSVFLAKIADEDRRKKAAALIAELGKVTPEEAEVLSKKMIIPVLKGVAKEEAEAAKAQFGKIGILARVKGPE